MGHTKGPWKVEKIEYRAKLDVNFEIIGSEDHGIIPLICQTLMREMRTEGQTIQTDEANAHLIAASPDLLAACLVLVAGVLAGDLPDGLAYRTAKTAIAKATGKGKT